MHWKKSTLLSLIALMLLSLPVFAGNWIATRPYAWRAAGLAKFTVETASSPQDFKVQIDAPSSLVIDWGDTNESTVTVAGITTHSYATAGTYQITLLSGTCTQFAFYGGTPQLLQSVDSVISSTLGLTSAFNMFRDCTNLDTLASGWFALASANVTTMAYMFYGATSANPDVSGWNTAAVTNMYRMFNGATSANPDTSGWNTAAVTNMTYMFNGATSANPDTSGWNTAAVTTMAYMFYGATSANPDISGFDVTALTTAVNMMQNSAFTQTNYDLMLVAWEAQAVLNNVAFNAGTAKFGAGAPATAKQALIDDHSWSFTDGGAE